MTCFLLYSLLAVAALEFPVQLLGNKAPSGVGVLLPIGWKSGHQLNGGCAAISWVPGGGKCPIGLNCCI